MRTRKTPPREIAILPTQDELMEGTTSKEERVRRAKALARSLDTYERTEGLRLLHTEDIEEAVLEARRALHERTPDMAIPAAQVLSMEGRLAPEDFEALGSMMQDGGLTPEERTAAAGALMGALRSSQSKDLPRWYDAALESDVAWVRGSAVAAVAQLPTDEALPLLAKALKDADPQVANGAKMALVHGHGGDESLGTDPAAWTAWLVEQKEAAAKKAADDLAMQNPKIERRPEDSPPGANYAPTPDSPEVPVVPPQE